jgi:CHAD domain-containing protein
MEYEPDASYATFGAEALLKRLQALTQESDGVRQAEDMEYIHRMRVASRRLRAALNLFQDTLPRKKFTEWEKQVKRITRALGAARDTDVQIAALDECLQNLPEPRFKSGVKRLQLRLQQRRVLMQTDVIEALDGWESGAIADDMAQSLRQTLVQARLNQVEAASPRVFQLAHSHISLRLEEFLSYESCVSKPEQVEELHAMRIAAKRLRYTLEIFAPLYEDELKEPLKAVREAQELLGDIHDCDVWAQYLSQFMEEERARTLEYFGTARAFGRLAAGLRHLEQDRQQRREKRYREFVRFWEQTQEQATWEHLRQNLQTHLTLIEPAPVEHVVPRTPLGDVPTEPVASPPELENPA